MQLLKILQLQQCTSGTLGRLVELPPGTTPGREGEGWRGQNSCLQIEMPVLSGHSVDQACKKNPPYSGPQFPHLLIEGTCSPLQTPVAVEEENYAGCGFSPTALSTL